MGELGSIENSGIVVSLKAFKVKFSDIKSSYVNSFLTAATFEPSQSTLSQPKYLFRECKESYLIDAGVVDNIDES